MILAEQHTLAEYGDTFEEQYSREGQNVFSPVLAAELSNYSPPRLPASFLYERQEVTLSAVFFDLALPACLHVLSESSWLMTPSRGHFFFLFHPGNHDFAKGRTLSEVEVKAKGPTGR